jgi:L-alanine-DL-glutamate epimerase-like enolase superfamily enzyme
VSTITNITVQTYAYELEDFGPGGTYQRGGKIRLEKFIVSIATDDGLAGSYAPYFGASPQALAQVKDMARGLIGHDAEQRERIFERLKQSHRHYDKSGIGALDAAL